MSHPLTRTDYVLWAAIAAYTGVIYATLSIVSKIRKALTERFGYGVFDVVYWAFGLLGCALLARLFREYRGARLARRLLALVIISGIYAYYLSGLKYSIERIHFLEYGLLGVLVFVALARRFPRVVSVLLSVNLVYWIGLGDEAIQWALPNRVGEIRDSITNLFSGALGVSVAWFFVRTLDTKHPLWLCARAAILFCAVTTVLTAVFICSVHGFGFLYETPDVGKVYSSLSADEFRRINSSTSARADVDSRSIATYENEARRHLLQREFYFSNDFMASDGSRYRDYTRCYAENRALEAYYGSFLTAHAGRTSGPLLQSIDREVAHQVTANPVVWPDSVRAWVAGLSAHGKNVFASRVKQTIITSFGPRDLLFYVSLILLLLGYAWHRARDLDGSGHNG